MNPTLPSFPKEELRAYERSMEEGISKASGTTSKEDRQHQLDRHLNPNSESILGKPMQPHSCKHCSRFIIDVSGPVVQAMPGFIAPKTLYFNDITFTDVKKGADDGCPLCQRIDSQFTSTMDIPDDQLTCFSSAGQGHGGEFDIESLSHICVWSVDRMWAKWDNKEHQNHYFDVHAADEDPASSFITTRPINVSTASDTTFKLARGWLAECRFGHQECQRYRGSFLPRRLIHITAVDGSLHLRLHQTSGSDQVEYTTLSYCWGGAQSSQLTTSNLYSYLLSIPISNLPQTIRDAIIVTHRLDISHIWIDSLCILQDDDEDKAIQIASMPQIYASSTLTVSTSRAVFAHEGFLQDRKPTNEPDFVFQLPYRLPSNGELGSIILSHSAPENSDNVLLSRAWAFQEHLLSPRILDWSGSQMLWICPGAKQSQGYIDGGSIRGSLRAEDNLREAVLDMSLPATLRRYTWGPRSFIDFWHTVLVAYTEKDMTISSDRALAIASIAALGGRISGKKYLAGHWRLEQMPWYFAASLMWSMKHRPERLPRPTVPQGPSWSWTAVSGPIHFWDVMDLLSGHVPKNFRVEVIECEIEPENEGAPFGAVRQGTLVLEGRVKPARWLRCRDDPSDSRRRLDYDDVVASNGDFIPVRMCPDAMEDDWQDQACACIDVVLLEVGYGNAEDIDSTGAKGLVLRPLDDGFYSRLGIFTVSRGEIQSRCEDLWRAEMLKNTEAFRRKNDDDAQVLDEGLNGNGLKELNEATQQERPLGTTAPLPSKSREELQEERVAINGVWERCRDVFKDCEKEVVIIV